MQGYVNSLSSYVPLSWVCIIPVFDVCLTQLLYMQLTWATCYKKSMVNLKITWKENF